MEKVLVRVVGDDAEAIRDILTKDAHLKLMQRFLRFVKENVTDEFYLDECQGNKLLRDDLEAALKNAYNIHSKYAHSLKKVVDQSSLDDTSRNSDYFRQLHEPYLTYSGLLRLTRHVIINLLKQLEKVEKEKIDWTGKLPGIITAHLGPEFWIAKMESDKCEGAKVRLEGYIEKLALGAAYDISEVIELYISRFDNVPEKLKKPIFSLTFLWAYSVKHSEKKVNTMSNFYRKIYQD